MFLLDLCWRVISQTADAKFAPEGGCNTYLNGEIELIPSPTQKTSWFSALVNLKRRLLRPWIQQNLSRTVLLLIRRHPRPTSQSHCTLQFQFVNHLLTP